MMDTLLLGRWGEAAAGDYLRKKRYRLIAANFSTRFGEIDLIATNREYIVFVEVKLRKNSDFAEPREFVTASKIEKIRTTASIWLEQHETDLQPRFDVIEIIAPEGINTKKPQINHIENAF